MKGNMLESNSNTVLAAKITDALPRFSGTEHWYRHSLNRRMTFTDGVKYLADAAGAYWLVDEIALRQIKPAVRAQEFQVWKLAKNKSGNGATLTMEDGNKHVCHTARIPFTDFPLPEVTLWFADNVILLPSEY